MLAMLRVALVPAAPPLDALPPGPRRTGRVAWLQPCPKGAIQPLGGISSRMDLIPGKVVSMSVLVTSTLGLRVPRQSVIRPGPGTAGCLIMGSG